MGLIQLASKHSHVMERVIIFPTFIFLSSQIMLSFKQHWNSYYLYIRFASSSGENGLEVF